MPQRRREPQRARLAPKPRQIDASPGKIVFHRRAADRRLRAEPHPVRGAPAPLFVVETVIGWALRPAVGPRRLGLQ